MLREGDPIQYILDSFAADHEGDEVVARCLIMSFASRSVINSNGLHVLVTGESGKGKSHAFDTMIQHIPKEFRLDGRLSDKALFYAEDLRAGSAICLDDISLSEQMQETLKGVTTSFKKPFIYRTVNKDRKGQTCVIPERCVWWVAKMDGTGDDQVWNRMLTCWIDDSPEQDEKVLTRELFAAAQLPDETEHVRDEMIVCQHIWAQLLPAHVVIPYAEQIRFSSVANRRNPGMLLDLVKSVAIIHQYQREETELKVGRVIHATTEDFKIACQMYQALNGESGGQMSKLTRSESELIQAIEKTHRYEFTVTELRDLLPDKSYNAIRKLLNGGSSHQAHYSGLLEKCPAISVLDRTDTSENGGTSRRQKVYYWDHDRYVAWASGGGCWLARNDDHDDDTGGSGGSGRKGGGSLPPGNEARDDDDSSKNNNKNNFYYNERKDEDLQSTHEPVITYDSAPENFRTSATSDQNTQSGSSSVVDSATSDDLDRGTLPLTTANTPRIPLSQIDPDDYTPINGVWSGPCAVCGGKWVQYVEKVTPAMKEEKRFTTRKICQKCRDKARDKISKTFTVLPGTVNITGMVRTNGPRGRCDVCHQNEMKWYDKEIHLGMCDSCFSREQERQGMSV